MCLNPAQPEYDLTALSDQLMQIMADIGIAALPSQVAIAVQKGMFTVDEGALLLGIAAYSSDDDGATIRRELEHWLRDGTDEVRVGLAVMHDTFLFTSRVERATILTRIAQRFPQYADMCRELIESSPD